MPRKNRCTALVLVLALLACLAGQAAALPLMGGSRMAANDSTAGDLVSAVLGWFSAQWAALGHVFAGPVGHALVAVEKTCGSSDPNNGCR